MFVYIHNKIEQSTTLKCIFEINKHNFYSAIYSIDGYNYNFLLQMEGSSEESGHSLLLLHKRLWEMHVPSPHWKKLELPHGTSSVSVQLISSE